MVLPRQNHQEDAPLGPYQIIENHWTRRYWGKSTRAHYPALNRIVALKVLLSEGKASQKEVDRLASEAQVMAMLKHPNIITVYGAGCENGQNYIVNGLCRGGITRELAKNKKKKVGPRKCLEIMHKIAGAMGYAHQENIIHRDLKPSNIMMGSDQRQAHCYGFRAG